MGIQAKHPVGTTAKSIEIVLMLQELDGATVTELEENLEMSKGTVHDHLSTLREYDLVQKRDDEYHIGLGFFELGQFARTSNGLYPMAKPEVDELAKSTGEVANIVVEEHGKCVYLYRATGDNAVTLDTHTGKRRYLHNTALGKAILAYKPKRKVREIVDRHGLPQSTTNTITDEESLFAELNQIREMEYATCDEERVEGLRCVAAPVKNSDGEAFAAISVAGPTTRMRDERFLQEIPHLVKRAANVIEINHAYS